MIHKQRSKETACFNDFPPSREKWEGVFQNSKAANENSLPLCQQCEIWGAGGQRRGAWMNLNMLSGMDSNPMD